MDPQLSVLMYSKYSATSKKLMDFIQSSGVDFTTILSLQLVCIDNDEIRNRILQNDQIDITSVPCLLIIYPDGGIEKYDGPRIFEWTEEIIRKYAPPPRPTPHPQKSEEQKWREQKAIERQQAEQQEKEKLMIREKIKEQNRRKYEQQQRASLKELSDEEEIIESDEPRRKPVNKEKGVTAIAELPSDEDDENVSDRYRRRRPVGRLRKNEGNYGEENEELFQGDVPDMRRPIKSAVKGNNAAQQKSLDIMAKAKEMAKGRESSAPPPPPGHPASINNLA